MPVSQTYQETFLTLLIQPLNSINFKFSTDITLTPMIFRKYVHEGDLLVEKYKMKQTSLRHIYLILADLFCWSIFLISLIVNPSECSNEK